MAYDPTEELKQLSLQNPYYNDVTGMLVEQPQAPDFNIPEFPVEQKPRTAQEERAFALGQAHAKEGFSTQVQPNGNILISNTPETRATVLGPQGATTPNDTLWGTSTGIQSRIQAMLRTEDPNSAIAMYGGLQEEVGKLKGQLWQDAFSQAASKLQIPQLEAVLAQNEQADRADPQWNKYQSDSPATAKVREQLARARAQVDNEAKNYLAGNTTLAGADAQLKIAGTLLERKVAAADRVKQAEENRQSAADIRLDTWKQQKEFEREMKDEQLLAQTPEVMMQRIASIDPTQATKTPIERAKYITYGLKDPEIKQALTATPDELPRLAFGAQNKAAQSVLIDDEVSKTGKTKGEVALEVAQINKMIQNPSVFAKQLQRFGISKEEASGLKAQLTNPQLLTKDQRVQLSDKVYQMAIQLKSSENAAEFAGNLDKWKVADPEFNTARANVKATVPNATMQDLYVNYIGDAKGPALREKNLKFKQWVKEAGAPYANSLIAPIDLNALSYQIDSYALPGLLTRLSNTGIPSAIRSGLKSPVPQVELINLGMQGAGWLYNQITGETTNERAK